MRLHDSGANTFVPCPFTCYGALSCKGYKSYERFVHYIFRQNRVEGKEFFETDLQAVLDLFTQMEKLPGITRLTEDEIDKINSSTYTNLVKAKKAAPIQTLVQNIATRAPNHTFEELKIPVNSPLVFRKAPEKTCVTID
jgi:hypothetical protein